MAIVPFRIFRDLTTDRQNLRSLSDFQREMNRMMDHFVSDWNLAPSSSVATAAGSLSLDLDVAETPKDFKVHVEIPGMEEKDIELSFHKGVLTLRGEKKFEKEESDKNYIRTERSYGSFARSLPFAIEIDESKIEAEYKNGVLNITLPKAASAVKEAKKIQIKSNS